MSRMLMSYESAGTGEALLLMHGALVSRAMWRNQIAEFSKTYQVIAPDLPAHGDTSDVEGDYTIASLSDSVARLLDSLGVERAHVCGHSLGGMVAQQFAASHPERVRKLVLAETAFSTQNNLWEKTQSRLALLFLKLIPHRTLVDLSVRQYGTIHHHVAAFIKQEMGRYDRKTTIRVMSAALRFDGKHQLGRIASPTLVLVAERNKRTHHQAGEMARRIPSAELITLPAAQHLLNVDNPDAFNTVVLEFLRS